MGEVPLYGSVTGPVQEVPCVRVDVNEGCGPDG